MVATLGAVTLENVQQINERKAGNMIVIPIPTKNSGETETFDLGGNTEVFEITGIFDGTTVAEVKTKKDDLKDLMNAAQAVIELITDQTGTVNVRVRDVSVTWDIGTTPVSTICNYNVVCVRTKGGGP